MELILLKFFRKKIIQIILKHLDKPEVKDRWVYGINMRIDLPNLNEEEEKKLFSGIIDAGFDEMKKTMKGI